MKIESVKMYRKWCVIFVRSPQQQTSQSEKSIPARYGSSRPALDYLRPTVSGAPTKIQVLHCCKFLFISFIIDCEYIGLQTCEFGDFDGIFDVFNNGFELQGKSDGDVLLSPTNNTISVRYCTLATAIDNDSTDVETHELNVIECDFNAVLTTTIPITQGIANENIAEYDNGVLCEQAQPHITHPTAPAIDTSFNIDGINSKSHEFNDIGCVFDVNNGIVFEYGYTSGMFIVFFSFVFCFVFFCDQTTFFVFIIFVLCCAKT